MLNFLAFFLKFVYLLNNLKNGPSKRRQLFPEIVILGINLENVMMIEKNVSLSQWPDVPKKT